MGDGEFGLRMYLNGFKSISNPLAYCIDVKAPEGGLRVKGGSWDAWRPKKWTDPRPVPSVLYLSRKYFGTSSTKKMVFSSLGTSVVPYRFKENKIYKITSIIIVPLILPLIGWQLWKSWKISSIKLLEGAKINYLK